MTKKPTVPQKKTKVVVEQNPDEIIPVSVLATAIRDISASAKKMLAGGLKEETIVILLHDHTKVGKPNIRAILRGLPDLADAYLKKPDKP